MKGKRGIFACWSKKVCKNVIKNNYSSGAVENMWISWKEEISFVGGNEDHKDIKEEYITFLVQ